MSCSRPECSGVGEYIPGARCTHETGCAYVRITRPASYWDQTEPVYETCDRDAIEGSAYCRAHRDCEESEES